MRRALLVLAVTAFTLVALAAPAGASNGRGGVTFSFNGPFASAVWSTSSATSRTDTLVAAANEPPGSELTVEQAIINLDANGNPTGGTIVYTDVTSGFSFTINQRLQSASVSGTGVPLFTCILDANLVITSCSNSGTIDVSVTWTGQGPISHGVDNFTFRDGGFVEVDHFNGTQRDATAAGTVGGLTLTASDLTFANLGTQTEGTIDVCAAANC